MFPSRLPPIARDRGSRIGSWLPIVALLPRAYLVSACFWLFGLAVILALLQRPGRPRERR